MPLSKNLCTKLSAGLLSASLMVSPVLAVSGTVTAEDGLHLRTGTDATSQTVTVLPSGTAVEVTQAVGADWYLVEANGLQGYVSSSHITLDTAPAAPADPGSETSVPTVLMGTVTASSSLNIRSGPGSGYSKVGALASGAEVELLERTDGWYRIEKGYISAAYVAAREVPASAEPEAPAVSLGMVTASSSLNVRSGPGSSYKKVGSLASGAEVELLELTNGWYRIENGYISAQYVAVIRSADSGSNSDVSELQARIAAYARTLLGKRYIYGATGPHAFDCSGLTQYVYKQFGYSIYRNATSQLKNGITVSKADLQPGDLVFFNSKFTGVDKASHVGVYIGDGKFLHASSPEVGVVISDLHSAYYTSVYTTARRIV